MIKKTALIICPGRGVYNASELGYLRQFHSDKAELISAFDAQRNALNQEPISTLDSAEKFSASKYTRGDNASGLIYACSYSDFLSIDRDAYDIVGITGNSMGWYTALACSGALSANDGFRVVNTMGSIMQNNSIGGQVLCSFVDENWKPIAGKKEKLEQLTHEIEGLYISIYLGGMIAFAGTDQALKELTDKLPTEGRFPMRLINHAAFHSELQNENSARGKTTLPSSLFSQPDIRLIDGRGHHWIPGTVNIENLWDYTFGHQITDTFDFIQAVISSVNELAPDTLIILGPGTTLGGATAQSLISYGWEGLNSKSDFTARQKISPILTAMGMETQRKAAI